MFISLICFLNRENYGTRDSFDQMGNVLSLIRQGLHDDGTHDVIDDLKYTYDGNKVIRVEDSAIDPVYKDCFTFVDGADDDTEYEYDENGNQTKDLNRGICGIEYNCLNLPSRVDFTDGSRITYTYDGGGRKLRTDYCANKVYESDTLLMSLFDGGYVSYDAKVAALSPSSSQRYKYNGKELDRAHGLDWYDYDIV